MPGALARTSTFALNNATIGHAVTLADKGWKQALKDNVHLKNGLNVAQGKGTYEAVAKDLGYEYVAAATINEKDDSLATAEHALLLFGLRAGPFIDVELLLSL